MAPVLPHRNGASSWPPYVPTLQLQRLDELLRRDPQRAKTEILKHLEGDLEIVPRPFVTGERHAGIRGRARILIPSPQARERQVNAPQLDDRGRVMNSIMVATFAFVGVLAGVLAQLHVRSRPR